MPLLFSLGMAGVGPASCDVLEQIAQNEEWRAVVWRGSGLDSREQGIKILGIPVGHHDFITAFIERKSAEHATLLERIPTVPDVQSAWLLLLHCAQARANFLLRGVQPSLCRPLLLQDTIQGVHHCRPLLAERHDNNLWHCLCEILNLPPEQCDAGARDTASLPLVFGAMGLRSVTRMRSTAFWADSLLMIWQRHPAVAGELILELEGDPATSCLREVVESVKGLTGVMAFEPTSWRQPDGRGATPTREPDEFEPP